MPGGGEKSVKAVLRIWEGCQRGLHDKGGYKHKKKDGPALDLFPFHL